MIQCSRKIAFGNRAIRHANRNAVCFWSYYIICFRCDSTCDLKHSFSLLCKEKTHVINILLPLCGISAANRYKNCSSVFYKDIISYKFHSWYNMANCRLWRHSLKCQRLRADAHIITALQLLYHKNWQKDSVNFTWVKEGRQSNVFYFFTLFNNAASSSERGRIAVSASWSVFPLEPTSSKREPVVTLSLIHIWRCRRH